MRKTLLISFLLSIILIGYAASVGFRVNDNMFFVNPIDGRVGIGTSSPPYLLALNGTNAVLSIDRKGNEPAVSFSQDGNALVQIRGSSTGLKITNGGATTEWLKIASDGKVGIGTSTPTQKLDVAGKVKATEFCLGTNCITTWPAGGSGSGSSQWASGTSGAISYSSGNVGIGTAAPTEKLDVAGKVKATQFCLGASCITTWPTGGGSGGSSQWTTSGSNIYFNGGNVGIGTGTSAPPYLFSLGGSGAVLNIDRTGQEPAIRLAQSNAGGGQIRGVSAGGLRFTDLAAGAEWLRISSNGNVGIGTNSPTEKLNVIGNAKIQGNLEVTGTISGGASQAGSGTWCGRTTSVIVNGQEGTYQYDFSCQGSPVNPGAIPQSRCPQGYSLQSWSDSNRNTYICVKN